jgi:hypothetical protein
MSYQLVNIHLGRNRMGGVMVNKLTCSEIVGSSHDLVKPKTIKYQDNVLLGIRTMCPREVTCLLPVMLFP